MSIDAVKFLTDLIINCPVGIINDREKLEEYIYKALMSIDEPLIFGG